MVGPEGCGFSAHLIATNCSKPRLVTVRGPFEVVASALSMIYERLKEIDTRGTRDRDRGSEPGLTLLVPKLQGTFLPRPSFSNCVHDLRQCDVYSLEYVFDTLCGCL